MGFRRRQGYGGTSWVRGKLFSSKKVFLPPQDTHYTLLPQLDLEVGGEAVAELVVCLVDFIVGKGAVGGTESEAVGGTFFAFAEGLIVGKEVEKFDFFQILEVDIINELDDFGVGQTSGLDECHVTGGGGERGYRDQEFRQQFGIH